MLSLLLVSPPHQYLGTQNNSLAASVVLLLLQTRYSSSLQKYKKIGPDKPIIALLYPYKALLLYKWLSFLLSWQSHQDQTFFYKKISSISSLIYYSIHSMSNFFSFIGISLCAKIDVAICTEARFLLLCAEINRVLKKVSICAE